MPGMCRTLGSKTHSVEKPESSNGECIVHLVYYRNRSSSVGAVHCVECGGTLDGVW